MGLCLTLRISILQRDTVCRALDNYDGRQVLVCSGVSGILCILGITTLEEPKFLLERQRIWQIVPKYHLYLYNRSVHDHSTRCLQLMQSNQSTVQSRMYSCPLIVWSPRIESYHKDRCCGRLDEECQSLTDYIRTGFLKSRRDLLSVISRFLSVH